MSSYEELFNAVSFSKKKKSDLEFSLHEEEIKLKDLLLQFSKICRHEEYRHYARQCAEDDPSSDWCLQCGKEILICFHCKGKRLRPRTFANFPMCPCKSWEKK